MAPYNASWKKRVYKRMKHKFIKSVIVGYFAWRNTYTQPYHTLTVHKYFQTVTRTNRRFVKGSYKLLQTLNRYPHLSVCHHKQRRRNMVRNILKRFTLVAVSTDSHFGTSFPSPPYWIYPSCITGRGLRGLGEGRERPHQCWFWRSRSPSENL